MEKHHGIPKKQVGKQKFTGAQKSMLHLFKEKKKGVQLEHLAFGHVQHRVKTHSSKQIMELPSFPASWKFFSFLKERGCSSCCGSVG